MMGRCCHGLHGGAVKQMNQTEEKARTVERSLFRRRVHMLVCGTVISVTRCNTIFVKETFE